MIEVILVLLFFNMRYKLTHCKNAVESRPANPLVQAPNPLSIGPSKRNSIRTNQEKDLVNDNNTDLTESIDAATAAAVAAAVAVTACMQRATFAYLCIF